jgi:hypothetical protein
MNKDIGIGIIDIYSDEDFELCYSSIPDFYKESVVVVSNKKKNNKKANKNYDIEVPFATLRNYIITQLRIKGFKYFYILNSNVRIKNPDVFNKTIEKATLFGTWFMLGPSDMGLVKIEDDDKQISLNLTPSLNSDFIFMYSGILKNFKFFEERYYNTYDFDIIDYIIKMRNSNIYPPKHYNPTIDIDDIEISSKEIEKINFKGFNDLQDNSNKSLDLSIAYFYYKHKYIPNQNDPSGVTEENLLDFMQKLQETYGNKN